MISTLQLLLLTIIPFAASTAHGSEVLKPILPLNAAWKPSSLEGNIKDKLDLFQDDAASKKLVDEFKGALQRLNKNQSTANQTKDVAILRQAALKLGPRARLIAELTAARVNAGLNASGNKVTNPNTSWRNHLLAACNVASKIDPETHEQTAIQAIALWRKVDIRDTSWLSPPIDIRAQKQFAFFKAITERQAIAEWSKGSTANALKRYRGLSRSLSGSPEGAAIDLRIVELERSLYAKSKQLQRWQRVLIEFSTKYQDQQILGTGNEGKAQHVSAAIARYHRELVDSLIREAMPQRASDLDQNAALKAIDTYLTTNISDAEKERVRAISGEIHFNAKHHKAAAGVFAALATESQGVKAQNYWRKAIRSQKELAGWPVDPPWSDIPKGHSEARTVLLDMYRKIDSDTASSWDVASHTGLLLIAGGQADEAFQYWTAKITKYPSGLAASRAAGWIAESRIKNKQWTELEALGRTLVKARLNAVAKSKSFRPGDILGMALLEGGLQDLGSGDFKSATVKLGEFVKGWRQDPRHDEAMYSLALSQHGDHQFRAAVDAMESFTKTYRRSKFRRDGLKKGGDWTLNLAWDEHVMYFLETHAREFPDDKDATASLSTLADLYLGREIYDSALRVLNTILGRKDLDADSRADVARRLIETAERHGSADNALRLAQRIEGGFRSDQSLVASTLSLRARIQSERGNLRELLNIDKAASSLDQSQPTLAEAVSEIKFLLAETLARGQFKEEFFSLSAKDPKAELERAFAQFTKIDQAYKAACLSVRTGWCGPALHRTARIGDQFVKSYEQLSIARTLEPKLVKEFYSRKAAIIESVENQSMEADEKSYEQARSGNTNPDWTSAIMWQNGGDWSREKYTSDNADHYIQWRTR